MPERGRNSYPWQWKRRLPAFEMQSFVIGSVMGIGGALYAYQVQSISPEAFTNFFGTFLIWTMVIVGGSGNNNGVLVGAYVVFEFWQSSLLIQSYDLPDGLPARSPFIRDLLLRLAIVIVLLLMPRGLIPEGRRVSIWAGRRYKTCARLMLGPNTRDTRRYGGGRVADK